MFNKHTVSMLSLASLKMYSKRNRVLTFVKFESVTRMVRENRKTKIKMKRSVATWRTFCRVTSL